MSRLLPLTVAITLAGCAWIPKSYVARADHSESTPFELVEGSPLYELIPRGWIAPVDRPRFASMAEAEAFMAGDEPVMAFESDGEVRLYSTWYLDGHEVVNDEIGDRAIAVTWCPLVQAGVVFDRRVVVDGRQRDLRLQASGRLWRDALVMWDRQTRSLWTQHDGRALQGASREAGRQLTMLPSVRLSWAEAKRRYPDAVVMRKPADLLGGGAATIYDDYLARTDQLGIFGTHLADDSLPGKALVLAFERPESPYALALETLEAAGGAAVSVGGDPVFAHALPGAQDGRVWSRVAGDATLLDLALEPGGETLVDRSRGARWDAVSGRSLDPERAGDLTALPSRSTYWFAWRGAHPETRLWAGSEVRDPRDAQVAEPVELPGA